LAGAERDADKDASFGASSPIKNEPVDWDDDCIGTNVQYRDGVVDCDMRWCWLRREDREKLSGLLNKA
jgi:hypothetical protein